MFFCGLIALTILFGVYGFISIIMDVAEAVITVRENMEEDRDARRIERREEIERFARQATKHYQKVWVKLLNEHRIIYARGKEVDDE